MRIIPKSPTAYKRSSLATPPPPNLPRPPFERKLCIPLGLDIRDQYLWAADLLNKLHFNFLGVYVCIIIVHTWLYKKKCLTQCIFLRLIHWLYSSCENDIPYSWLCVHHLHRNAIWTCKWQQMMFHQKRFTVRVWNVNSATIRVASTSLSFNDDPPVPSPFPLPSHLSPCISVSLFPMRCIRDRSA